MEQQVEASVESRVVAVVAKQLGLNLRKVELKDKLTEDLGADSLDLLQISTELEIEFDINLEGFRASDGMTVQAVAHVVRRALSV